MADFRTRAQKIHDELETYSCAKKVKKRKNDGYMLKGYRSQLKGAPTGKIWDNLSTKMNNDSKC